LARDIQWPASTFYGAPATGIDFFWIFVAINTGSYQQLTASGNNPPPNFQRRPKSEAAGCHS
jgi:hypothetical protein